MPEFGWCRSLRLGQDPEIRLAPNPSCPAVCPGVCPGALLPINRGAPARETERVLCLAVAAEGQARRGRRERGGGGELNAGHDSLDDGLFLPDDNHTPLHYLQLLAQGDWAARYSILLFVPFRLTSAWAHRIILCPCLYASLASPATTTHCSSQASSDSTHHQFGSGSRPCPRQSCPTLIARPPSSLINFGSQSLLDCSNPATLLPPDPWPHKLSTALSTLRHEI